MVMPVFLSVLLALLTGCTGMVQEELDETHAKLAALQRLVNEANDQLVNLNRIVSELDDSHTVLPGSFEATEGGFKLSFKDGETIEIKPGIDGLDGRVFPIGVDSLRYWTIDYLDGNGPVWLTDDNGDPIRAGVSDGEDGITPEIKVEEDGWYLYIGEEKTKIAGLGEMDGVGIFRDAYEDAEKIFLEQWSGFVLELPKYSPIRISFSGAVRDTVLITGGETLPIPFEVLVEGNTEEQPLVVTSGTDGTYFSEIVKGAEPGKDTVLVTAPAEFEDGYIVLSAFCGGSSALKMITFRPREVAPAEKELTVRMGREFDVVRDVAYKTNFPYVIIVPEDVTWLEVNNEKADTLTFKTQVNEDSEIRTCDVIIAPADNPKQVISVFHVIQATNAFKFYLDEGSTLTYEAKENTLYSTAAGGDAVLWITFPETVDLSLAVPETATWLHAELTAEDGFRKLQVHVDPFEDPEERRESIFVQLQAGGFPISTITVVQAGATTGESE